MDEISTGLDASVTYDICASIRAWATETRGTVVISLLQPTPETYNLFSDVLLLRDGAVVYLGSRTRIPAYLGGLGFEPPTEESADVAAWLAGLLASPTKVLCSQTGGLGNGAPRTTEALCAAWVKSEQCAASLDAPLVTMPLELRSDFARRQYGQPYPRSRMAHFVALLWRSITVVLRNRLYVFARISSSVVVSVILGLVWFKLREEEILQKFGSA